MRATSAKTVLFLVLFAVLAPLQWIGCAGGEVNENDPASLFKDAEEDIEDDQYAIALEKLRTIRHKFPYSKFSSLAQLRIADVYFLEGSYAEAASAYESFRDLHPKHERSSYAMFRIGEAYLQATPENIARDLSTADSALTAFNAFLARYPNDERATEARKQIDEIRGRLAAKELYIGDFYLKRGDAIAAVNRYDKLIELFPNTEAAKAAKEKLPEVREEAAELAKERAEKEAAIRARERN